MPTIVCFGDSNTWGYDPESRGRFPSNVRWVGVLAAELEANRPGAFTVIAEGQNGRTTLWDDPVEGQKNGSLYLLPCLESHKPVDLLVIMLGTNDLKARFGLTPWDIAHGAARLAAMALASDFGPSAPGSLAATPPRVLLVAPPPLGRLSNFAEMFEGGVKKSKRLGAAFAAAADEVGCELLDAGKLIRSSDRDGVHFEPAEHKRLGRSVAERIMATFT